MMQALVNRRLPRWLLDRVSWGRDALGLSLLVLDSFAFAAAVSLLFLLNGLTALAPPPGIFLGILFAAYVTSRALEGSGLSVRRARWTAGAIAALTVFVAAWNQYGRGLPLWDPSWLGSFLRNLRAGPALGMEAPTEFLAILSFGLAWWRGARLAQGPNTFAHTLRSLRWGVLAFAVALALAGAFQETSPVGFFVIPYVALGLLALAQARQARWFDETQAALAPSRLAIAVTVISALVGLAAAVALVFGLELFDLLLKVLVLFQTAVGLVLYQVLLGLGYLAEWLVNFLREHATIGDPFGSRLREPLPTASPTPAAAGEDAGPLIPPLVTETANWLVLAGLIAAGLTVLAFLMRPRGAGSRREDAPLREAVAGAGSLGRELAALLARRPRRRRRPEIDRRSVRGLYRLLLERAAALGTPHAPTETPYEFEPKAEAVLPHPPVAALTEAYVRARYGEEELSPEQFAALRREWEAIEGR